MSTIPTGIVAMWSGALLDVPSDWDVCDGTNSTPDLVDRFIKGAPAGQDPGATGGSNTHGHSISASGGHSHTISSEGGHQHSISDGGNHVHSGSCEDKPTGSQSAMRFGHLGLHDHPCETAGEHSHSNTSVSDHNHSMDDADNIPPSYKVAFIRANTDTKLKQGIIIMWQNLNEIPSGFGLCDGTNDTPDFDGRFAYGSNSPGSTVGSEEHNHSTSSTSNHSHDIGSGGSHSHSLSYIDWDHSHETGFEEYTSVSLLVPAQGDNDAGHSHTSSSVPDHDHGGTISGGSHSHTTGMHSNVPSCRRVGFIMALSEQDAVNKGIFIWTGLLSAIPTYFKLCDGSEGTPDYRSLFVYGTTDNTEVDNTEGSTSHGHNTSSESHNHTTSYEDDHGHSSNSAGEHDHNHYYTAIEDVGGTYPKEVLTDADAYGSHSHTLYDNGEHRHFANSISHSHSVDSASDVEPQFYEVAFVMYEYYADPEGETMPAINITTEEARIRGRIAEDAGCDLDARFRWRIRE